MSDQDVQSAMTPMRRERNIASRFNPIRGLTPQTVVRYIEDFRRGIYRESTWAMQCVEETDSTLQSAAPKRQKSVSRLDWDIVTTKDAIATYGSTLVRKQRQALKRFYDSLSVTHAVDLNQRGGVAMLIRNMQDAVGKRYAVHEIAWQPQSDGSLKANFNFVPLWFFENRTGHLRFLVNEGDYIGEDLDPQGWLIHTGSGLMIACLVAYIYKTLPLKDWLTFSERCGMPAFIEKTTAAYGSKEWDEAVQMVHDLAAEFCGVISAGAELTVHDLKGGATQDIYERLVDRMDRAMAALWRGNDLSTLSAGNSQGASLQHDESSILQDDDVAAINETLNSQIDPVVIDWIFGKDSPHTVYFQLRAPDRTDQAALLQTITGAVNIGAKIPESYLREKLGYPEPEGDEAVITPASMHAATPPVPPPTDAANAAAADSRKASIAAMSSAMRSDLEPLDSALARIASAKTAEEITAALDSANALITRNAARMMAGSRLAAVQERVTATSVVAGAISDADALNAAGAAQTK